MCPWLLLARHHLAVAGLAHQEQAASPSPPPPPLLQIYEYPWRASQAGDDDSADDDASSAADVVGSSSGSSSGRRLRYKLYEPLKNRRLEAPPLRPATSQEGTEYLQYPEFSTCTVPLLVFPSWRGNFFHTYKGEALHQSISLNSLGQRGASREPRGASGGRKAAWCRDGMPWCAPRRRQMCVCVGKQNEWPRGLRTHRPAAITPPAFMPRSPPLRTHAHPHAHVPDLSALLYSLLRRTPWRQHAKLVVVTPEGIALTGAEAALLPPLSGLSVQSMADASARLAQGYRPEVGWGCERC